MTLDIAITLMCVPFVVAGLLSLGACKAASDADDLEERIYEATRADNVIPFERKDVA